MKMIILILVSFCISLYSCHSKNDSLREVILKNQDWYMNCRYFPVKIVDRDIKDSDTIEIVTTVRSIVCSLNIDLEIDNFPRLLYRTLKLTNGVLSVNHQYHLDEQVRRIINIPEVDSVYNSSGIKGILSEYVNSNNGELVAENDIQDYIIYLCFQHGIYFDLLNLEDGPGIFLVKYHK